MNKKYCIYKIVNKINNKVYIGLTTTDLKKRWSSHVNTSSNCKYLSSAIKKYGKDNFIMEPVFYANSVDDMMEMEILFIRQYNSLAPDGYNLREGGQYGEFTEMAKDKLKVAAITRWDKKERSRQSEVYKDKWKNKTSMRSRLSGLLEAQLKKRKKVIRVNLITFDYEILESVNKARMLGYYPWDVLSGRANFAGQDTWYYYEESNDPSFYINQAKIKFPNGPKKVRTLKIQKAS